MLATRIREVLRFHPYWGPARVARALNTTSGVVRVVASREKIRFMDREQVEDWVDAQLNDDDDESARYG